MRAIEQATAHVLLKHGFEKTSTNKVAERAGVSIGTLYQYFPNLESVINHIIDQQIGRHFDTMSERLEGLRGEPVEKVVEAMLDALLGLFDENRKVRAMLFQRMGKFDASSRIPQFEDRFREILEREMRAQWDERAKVDDARTASFVLVHAVLGTVRASLYEHRGIGRAELLPELRKLVLRYLL